MLRRNTIQRELVLEAVRALKNHATAEEVYNEVIRNHPSVGKGTVYRNLNILAEDGDIRKVEMPQGPDRFDHRTDSHHHIRCMKCGRVYDVEMKGMPDLKASVSDAAGMVISDYDIIFKGICPDCTGI